MFTTLHIMKNIILTLALVLPLVLSAQYSSDYLQRFTESGKTGWRFSNAVAANYGNIGSEAVDLSYSSGASTTRGARGSYSTAMGYNTTVSGDYSTAMGVYSYASGDYSTAMGEYTTASGTRSTAMGESTIASGEGSTAMGEYTTASGYSSTAMGEFTTASGDYSTAMGYETTASHSLSLVSGQYNSVGSSVPPNANATSFDTDNAAFVIGNGTSSNAKSDAFVVYFNGDATLSGDLTINSDERLKDNIQPLGSTLNKLHQIEAKTYSFKKDEEHTPKIGVLAQEVQAVFPELVTEGADGILSVNYQGLVPVLINAINEQELKMSEQDAKIAALEAKNSTLSEVNTRLAQLEELVKFYSLHASQSSTSLTLHRN